LTTYTIECTLIAKECDSLNYQTLVFKNLENAPFGHKYCMVVVFPNWESRIPDIGEIGYLEYDEVEGGVDKYYDRTTCSMNKYNFSNLIFKKFIKKVDSSNKNIIL